MCRFDARHHWPMDFDQTLICYGNTCPALQIRLVPNAKESTFPVNSSERCISLHEPFIERTSFRRSHCQMTVNACFVFQCSSCGIFRTYAATDDSTNIGVMAVIESAISIRQTEYRRPEQDTESVWKPFCQKINPCFTAHFHIRPHIQKFMGGDWFQEPFANFSEAMKPHVAKREGN